MYHSFYVLRLQNMLLFWLVVKSFLVHTIVINLAKLLNFFETETRKEAFYLVGNQLQTVQACALLEIVHPLMGWVKTGVFMPFIQVRFVFVYTISFDSSFIPNV